jgi:hypothetical protein
VSVTARHLPRSAGSGFPFLKIHEVSDNRKEAASIIISITDLGLQLMSLLTLLFSYD